MRAKSFLLWLVSLLLAASASRAAWHHLPMGLPYFSGICDNSQGDRLFLDASSAGLWRSQNGGTTWTPVSSRLCPGGQVYIDAVETVDGAGDTLVASLSRHNAYYANCYSFDGGTTWQNIADDAVRMTGRIAVWRGGHNVWFHRNSEWSPTVFRWSTDFGQTWLETNSITLPQNTYIFGLYQDPQHDSTLFLACDYFPQQNDSTIGGLYRSDDLGRTWRWQLPYLSLFGSDMAETRDVIRLSNGNLAVAAWTSNMNEVMFTSSDDGETWTQMQTVPDTLWPYQIFEDTLHPDRLFVSGHCPGGVARSDDGGQTWQSGLPGLPQSDHAGGLFQNRLSGRLYLLSNKDGVFQSNDHGDHWLPINLPPIGALCQFSVTPQAAFAHEEAEAGWTRHWRCDSGQTQWQELSLPGGPIYPGPIIYGQEDTLYALANESFGDGSAGLLLRSTDNGTSWSELTRASSGINENVYSVHSSGSSTQILVSAWEHEVFSTTDLGQSWTLLTPLPGDLYAYDISQTTQAIYLNGYDLSRSVAAVCRSTDGGVSWDTLQPPGAHEFHAAIIADEVYVDALARCLHWSNGTWDTLTALPFGGDPHTVYWQMIEIPGNPTRLVGIRKDSLSLWVSENRGQSWVQLDILLPYREQNASWDYLTYDGPRQRLWVSAGVGACYLDIAELSTPSPLRFQPADFTVLKAYPNPFNPATRIRFDLEKRGNVKVEVFDLQGRLVQTLVNGMQESGRHEVLFDGSARASGTYFVRLHSPFATQAEKILLLR